MALIETQPGVVQNVMGSVEAAAASAAKIKTFADYYVDLLGLQKTNVQPGSTVPGPVPAPTVTNYQAAWGVDAIGQSIKDVRSALSNAGNQIKGFFNIAYESPTGGQTAADMGQTVTIDAMPINTPILVIIALAALLYFGGR